jgi:hypothetical protein
MSKGHSLPIKHKGKEQVRTLIVEKARGTHSLVSVEGGNRLINQKKLSD